MKCWIFLRCEMGRTAVPRSWPHPGSCAAAFPLNGPWFLLSNDVNVEMIYSVLLSFEKQNTKFVPITRVRLDDKEEEFIGERTEEGWEEWKVAVIHTSAAGNKKEIWPTLFFLSLTHVPLFLAKRSAKGELLPPPTKRVTAEGLRISPLLFLHRQIPHGNQWKKEFGRPWMRAKQKGSFFLFNEAISYHLKLELSAPPRFIIERWNNMCCCCRSHWTFAFHLRRGKNHLAVLPSTTNPSKCPNLTPSTTLVVTRRR